MSSANCYSLFEVCHTSASSCLPSWSLSRVSRDCWINLRMKRRNLLFNPFLSAGLFLTISLIKLCWRQILCFSTLCFFPCSMHFLDQPAPLKILHQLHKGNSIQLNALKTLIEPATKVWACLSNSNHVLHLVRMLRCSSFSLESRSASASSFSTRASTASAV